MVLSSECSLLDSYSYSRYLASKIVLLESRKLRLHVPFILSSGSGTGNYKQLTKISILENIFRSLYCSLYCATYHSHEVIILRNIRGIL